MLKGYTKFHPEPLCAMQDDTNGLTDSYPLFVERVNFRITHFTQVAHSEGTSKIQKWYNSLRVLELQLSAFIYSIAMIQPEFMSQFQTRHVFLPHRFSIKTDGSLIKSFVLFPLH
jgi:hypothetical protein